MKHALLLLRLSLRNILRNRRRSLSALAIVGLGAAGLFIFMGFNRGIMNQYRANTIRARWGHGQVFVAGYRGKAHARPSEKWIEHPDAVQEQLRALPGVVDLFPRVTLNAMLQGSGGQTVLGRGEGIDGVAEARFFDQLNYVAGGDFKEDIRGIVLGRGLAQGLDARVGDKVRLLARDENGFPREAALHVTGIFHTGSEEFDNRAFRVPLPAAQKLLGTSRVECIAVALTEVNAWPAFARAAVARATALPGLEAVPFDELDAVYYRHAVDWLDAQFGFIRGILLLMVLLSIVNIISMTVAERTAEIGTLRANGGGSGEIALGYLLEAAALGALGGVLGLLLGWALCAGPLRDGIAMPPAPGITRSYRILIELDLRDGLQTLLLCCLTATAASLLPVRRALSIPIAQALRHA